jgi:hypothetical protein
MQNSTPSNNYRSNTYFIIAFGLINATGLTLLFCTLGLLAGVKVSWWQFPLGCLAMLPVNYFAAVYLLGQKPARRFINTGLLVFGLIAASIFSANCFYDFSFDGQWYHQETVYRLKQGYNPIYQNLPVPADELAIDNTNDWCFDTGTKSPIVIPVNLKMLNINYFSKSSEIIESAIYQTTNHIECGKAVNIIIMVASFFLSLALFYKIDGIRVGSKWLLAFIVTFNPITITELLTFCVDGFGASLLLCIIALFCLLWLQPNRYYYLLLGFLIIITDNVKFTTLVYTVMFCAGFIALLLLYKRFAHFRQAFIAIAVSMFIGVICCGFNPYVTNLVKKHDIFYGLKDTRTEIKRLTPRPLLNSNRFEGLFLSLTSHQGWHVVDTTPVSQIPKIPFAININDILQNNELEPSVSGFGPFFSGSLLVAIIIFIIAIINYRKTPVFKYGLASIIIILATVLIIPDPWWARFVPQLWLVPAIILGMAEFMTFKFKKPLTIVLYASLVLNVLWSSIILLFVLFNTSRVNYQFQQIRALNKPINIEYCNYRCFKTNRIRFMEAGIPLTDKTITGGNEYVITYSTSKIKTPAPLPVLPKSIVLKLAERLTGK